jgi:hypothetical protein
MDEDNIYVYTMLLTENRNGPWICSEYYSW